MSWTQETELKVSQGLGVKLGGEGGTILSTDIHQQEELEATLSHDTRGWTGAETVESVGAQSINIVAPPRSKGNASIRTAMVSRMMDYEANVTITYKDGTERHVTDFGTWKSTLATEWYTQYGAFESLDKPTSQGKLIG